MESYHITERETLLASIVGFILAKSVVGIEPTIELLQSHALPLGYTDLIGVKNLRNGASE